MKALYLKCLFVLFLLFLSFSCAHSETSSNATKDKVVTNGCKSDLDKKLCDYLFQATTLYYVTVTHEQTGNLYRDRAMQIILKSIATARDSAREEHGDLEVLEIYEDFMKFVYFKEEALKLYYRGQDDESLKHHAIADESIEKVKNYCSACVGREWVDGFNLYNN
jgi:hypothetical protein